MKIGKFDAVPPVTNEPCACHCSTATPQFEGDLWEPRAPKPTPSVMHNYAPGPSQREQQQQQYRQQQQRPPGFVEAFAGAVAEILIARAVHYTADACQAGVWHGLYSVRDTYRYFRPLTAEKLLREALLTRRDIVTAMRDALADNRTSILISFHRLSDPVRTALIHDGYQLTDGHMEDGSPVVQVSILPPTQAEKKASKS